MVIDQKTIQKTKINMVCLPFLKKADAKRAPKGIPKTEGVIIAIPHNP